MKKLFKTILLLYFVISIYVLIFIDVQYIYQPFLHPSFKHFLGTNSYGLDIFTILFSATMDIFIVCCFGFISFMIAIVIGCTQGYLKGKYDFFLQRIYEIMISIPYFYIIILFSGYYSLNIFNLGLILVLFNWTFLIPIIRICSFRISQASFIEALEQIDYSKKRILFIHVIPNVYFELKYLIPFVLILFITNLTSLDFLGLLSKSNISIGGLILEGVNYLHFPIILISSVMFLSLLFIGLIMIFNTKKYYEGI